MRQIYGDEKIRQLWDDCARFLYENRIKNKLFLKGNSELFHPVEDNRTRIDVRNILRATIERSL